MKKFIAALAVAAIAMMATVAASADVKDILGNLGKLANKGASSETTTEQTTETTTTSETGQAQQSTLDKLLSLGNALGIIPSKAVDAAYLQGTWQYVSPAVAFKSDNLLAKAGGIAAAEKVKKQIEPYYQRFGLNKTVLQCSADSTFTLKASSLSLSGNFTTNPDGQTLTFSFKLLGKVPVGNLTTWVNATSSTQMDITFDMAQFMSLLKKASAAAAALSGKSSLTALSGILEQYDGLTVGFTMKKTSSADPSSAK